MLALGAVTFGGGCKSEPEPIAFGTVMLEPSLPLFVADEKGFFTDNGLVVTFRIYDVGANAATGLVNHEVDMASPVAEYPFINKIFGGTSVKAVASMDKVDYAFVIGRKDRGIQQISDLKGKKIGVVRGTILEFQLGRFLELNGIKPSEVTLVSGSLAQGEAAIKSGEVDAVMTIPPFTVNIQQALGSNASLWPAQNSQPFYSLVLADGAWVNEHPKTLEKFLTAMRQAEEFIAGHPDEAKAILKQKLNFSDTEIARVWEQNRYVLSLDQSLITAMEDQARWIIQNGLTAATSAPDFLDFIHEDPLKKINPDAVNIIR